MTFSSAFSRCLSGAVLAAAYLLCVPAAQAQKYRTAAGFRLGAGNYGVTVQHKILDKVTLEGIGVVGTREFSGTVLAERHFGILGPSLNYYLGAGGHLGNHKDDGAFGGFDGIVGAEYKVAFFPLVLSFDFKPSVEFNSADWARFPTAFSVRYVFVKEKKTGLFDGILGGDKDKKNKPRKKEKTTERRGLFDF
ncbi:hypothetical protein [Hymenobacter cellulosilyticus]|uniref:Outer membrane protein beta-barrel domain-containing protein n=1 Tax=Hymenobacter cellulosilyticus TaxID=2932248 RepID=A0A8T9Q9E7_9BACT|nr:hypothetical protein [Hymenobacter cellulosilyticus]UOQ73612.1 hypothetical protein MUN79_06705 [Hymenobacter cellulosilyticus]